MSRIGQLKCPVRRLLKRDLVWLGENYCRHRHTYLSHYPCFLSERPETSPLREKIGILDIETTGLKANWSHMLSWCIKDHGEDIIHHDLLTMREVRDKNDLRIVKSVVKKMRDYDRLVGYYSTRFDLPYIRSRALSQGVEFPAYRDIYHTDLYFVARSKFTIHSNRLASICQFFGIEAKNHPMTPDLWQRAGAGEKEALDTILLHNKEDVESTDKVFVMLLDHMAMTNRSV